MNLLNIKNLHVKIKKKKIIKGLNIILPYGETHILMGPNGSGKSTLSYTISGNKKYKITKGKIYFKNKNIKKYSINKRFTKGIFIAFQNNIEIPGLNNLFFLYQIVNIYRKKQKKKEINFIQFKKNIYKKIKILKYSSNLLNRSLNENFSGGEKKKNELLQILLIKPKLIILDELDSGLDIDTFKNIFKVINKLKNKKRSFLIITHNQKIINYTDINSVHIMHKGKIIEVGEKKIIKIIENKGYKWFTKKNKN